MELEFVVRLQRSSDIKLSVSPGARSQVVTQTTHQLKDFYPQLVLNPHLFLNFATYIVQSQLDANTYNIYYTMWERLRQGSVLSTKYLVNNSSTGVVNIQGMISYFTKFPFSLFHRNTMKSNISYFFCRIEDCWPVMFLRVNSSKLLISSVCCNICCSLLTFICQYAVVSICHHYSLSFTTVVFDQLKGVFKTLSYF